jgi:hypothetical protein
MSFLGEDLLPLNRVRWYYFKEPYSAKCTRMLKNCCDSFDYYSMGWQE